MNHLANYQSFSNKLTFNEAISLHMNYHRQELNETDREVLQLLSRYAVKYPGVAHIKVATIMKQIPKHTRTIRRSLAKLERFHIFKKQAMLREKSGGQGANLYIFLPFDRTKKTSTTQIEEAKQASGHNFQPPVPLVPVTHYTRFSDLVASYLGSHAEKTIHTLYNIFSHQASKLMKFSIHEDRGPLFEALSLEAVAILFQTTKRKKVYNLFSYYEGIYRELINRELFSDAFFDYEEPVEFLLPHEM